MKNTILPLLIAVTMISFSASSQIQKGNLLVGGNIANVNLGLNDPKIFSVDITPKVAWFIKDNIALGGYAQFGLEAAKHTSTSTSYGIGALGRYYTGPEGEVVSHSRFFAEVTAGFGGVNVSGTDNTNGVNLSAGPGFAYFINPNIGLEVLFKYNGLVGLGSTPYQSNLNLSFGFQIYLPGKSTVKKVENDFK
ncbi:outer membrane beta-barrel protein [Flavobacterium sp. DGU11]|uniref:Outer membrane beta-barrel protein n=1 Tax=Flavobacterium arundinis TaxID=3139143 RepID=A0ABU9HZ17_9FLAO